ncbi:GNAT family N-acetyltransferase [Flexivirga alba]|uniref:GNAT family N-acetyltransferase n=1 Tax=Flexivirga alba TaxID=702742 RepID=A0ABW2AJD8_9MICO
MPDWTIRPPEPGDVESLAVLHVAVWRYAYRGLIEQPLLDGMDLSRSVRRWDKTITSLSAGQLGHTVLAAFVDEEPVGIVEAGPAADDEAPRSTELLSLNVAGKWHGRGVAQALTAEAVGDADAYLWVLRGNERAIGFYRKLGFELDGTERYDDVWRCFDQRMQRPAPDA